jgi:hypothetical protein
MAGRNLSYAKDEAIAAIAASKSWAESLRRLGLCSSGGAWRILKKYAEIWEISTEHFDPRAACAENLRRKPRPLSEVLVKESSYPRKDINRLLAEGLKDPTGYASQQYCSRECGVRWDRSTPRNGRPGCRGVPVTRSRKAERPPHEKLVAEIEAHGYCAVGRKYGVSDNAVRKWVRFYERQRERESVEVVEPG